MLVYQRVNQQHQCLQYSFEAAADYQRNVVSAVLELFGAKCFSSWQERANTGKFRSWSWATDFTNNVSRCVAFSKILLWFFEYIWNGKPLYKMNLFLEFNPLDFSQLYPRMIIWIYLNIIHVPYCSTVSLCQKFFYIFETCSPTAALATTRFQLFQLRRSRCRYVDGSTRRARSLWCRSSVPCRRLAIQTPPIKQPRTQPSKQIFHIEIFRFFTSSLLAFQKRGWEENGSQDLCTNPERPGCPQSSSWFWMFWKLMKLAIDWNMTIV